MDVVDAEDEADEVEGDEEEDGQVEEDEEAEGDGGVHEAGNLTDFGIEGREVRSVVDLAEQGGGSEDQWKAPSKSWVVEEFPGWARLERWNLHHPERPDHVEAGHRHPAEHGEVAEETKEPKDGADQVTWGLVGIVVVDD